MPLPPDWGDDALSKYIGIAINSAFMELTRKKPQYDHLASIDHRFSTIRDHYSNFDWSFPFLVRAHAGYRAACQLVMSGQITESFPIMRACLEYSLYALHINKDKAALEVWTKLPDGNASEQSISRQFTMTKLKATLDAIDPKLCQAVTALYQQVIDFGAHPNHGAIAPNLKLDDEQFKLEIIVLHDADSRVSELGMRYVIQIGWACLFIFAKIFPEHLKDIEVDVDINQFQEQVLNQVN